MGSAHLVGVFNAEGPPVPIPNTEVKLCSGENTCLATDREDSSLLTNIAFDLILIVSYDWRYRKNLQVNSSLKGSNRKQGIYGNPVYPFKHSSLAQSVERMTVNHDVAGSSPAGGAKQNPLSKEGGFLFVLFTIHYSSFIIHLS